MNGGRVTCPRCGANNFETVVACWKCGAALTPAAQPETFRAPQPVAGATPLTGQLRQALPVQEGDPRAAQRAAIWLGLSLPYFGYPIGWAFIMMQDYKRQAMGRACILWSTIGLVAHFVLMLVGSAALTPMLVRLLSTAMSSQGGGNGANGGSTDEMLKRQMRGLDGGNP